MELDNIFRMIRYFLRVSQVILFILLILPPVNSYGGVIREGSPVCVSLATIDEYTRYNIARDSAGINYLREKGYCIVMPNERKASVITPNLSLYADHISYVEVRIYQNKLDPIEGFTWDAAIRK